MTFWRAFRKLFCLSQRSEDKSDNHRPLTVLMDGGTVHEKYRPTPCSGDLASTAQDRRRWGEEIKDKVLRLCARSVSYGMAFWRAFDTALHARTLALSCVDIFLGL